jgi:gliding motility-associated-like protein
LLRLFLSFISFGLISFGFAQQTLQNNNWMFGATTVGFGIPQSTGPSLNFNNCSPTVANNSPGAQFEGQTAISDATTGNLLFYSSGSQLRNALGQIMPGGNLVATSNSISQNLIVKKPGSSTIYYHFSPETQAGAIISTTNPGLNGFSYSIIDMSLAGGLGAVVSSGNLLQPFQNCEMVTGVYHPNGQDIWIIGHKYGNNTFFAYLLTPSGINPTPVFSSVGPSIVTPGTSVYANSNYDAVGELKASPDGSKLALTTFYSSYTCLFQFDNTNGVVSNPIPLSLGPNSAGYGTSFSQDNSKLYFSRVDPTQGGVSFLNNGAIIQFDITTYSQAAIQASFYVVFSSPTGFRSLKLGPNGKLYAARTTQTAGGNGASYLAVINNPNQAGAACNFVNDGIFIGANSGRWGLNNTIEEFFTCNDFVFSLGPDTLKCPENSVTITAPANQNSYLWNTNATTQSITVTQPGTYWVNVSGPNGVGSDTIVIQNFPAITLNILGNSGVCPGDSTILSVSSNFTNYLWNNGSQIQNNIVGAGTYWVSAIDTNGCIATDTTVVAQWLNPVISITGDFNVCSDQLTNLQVTPGLASYQWSSGQSSSTVQLGAGVYSLNVIDNFGCQTFIDLIEITEYPATVLTINGANGVCQGNTTELIASPNFTNYTWNTGEQSQNIAVGSGTFWVTATDTNGCTAQDTANVGLWSNPPINFIGDTIICTGENTIISATQGYSNYEWSTGQSAASVDLNAGDYYLTVTDSLGCQSTGYISITNTAPIAVISSSSSQIFVSSPIQFQSNSSAGLFALSSWFWDFGDGNYSNQENPSYNYTEAGNYNITLLVTDQNGCKDSTSITIQLDPNFAFYVPNTFSPDGDNLNQIFKPIFSTEIDPSNFQMLIFNRWGEIIFESQDPNTGWNGYFGPNGNQSQTGTYTYIISFKDPSTNELLNISGHVNLIR